VCKSNDNIQTEHSSSLGKKENMSNNKKQKVADDEVLIPSQSDIDNKVNKTHWILDHLRRKNGASRTLSKVIWRI